MRILLVILVCLTTTSPVVSQNNDRPRYIECSAEIFMLDRSEAVKPADDLVGEFNNATSDSRKNDALGDLYVVYSEIRDKWLAQQAMPDCVDTLRQLDMQWLNAMMDYIAMVSIAKSTGNQYYVVLAKQKFAVSKEIGDDIEERLFELDWMNGWVKSLSTRHPL